MFKHALYWFHLFGFMSLLSFSAIAAAESSLRINAQNLHNQINQPGLVILDTRSPKDYQAGHIPGAFNFPEAWTYHKKESDGRIVQPALMQKRLRTLGISIKTPVIVYDQGNLTDAARVFWALEVYGLQNIRVLSKGYNNWTQSQFLISTDTPTTEPSHYIPEINHDRLATRLTTLIASKNPNQVIIDTRPIPAYKGEISSAQRYGHIASAINIPTSDNLVHEQSTVSIKPKNELQQLYSGISKANKIILYCSLGRISTTNYLTLRELGYNVANYDASWNEWGNDFSLPIE